MTDNILRMIDYERKRNLEQPKETEATIILLPMIRDDNYLKEIKKYVQN